MLRRRGKEVRRSSRARRAAMTITSCGSIRRPARKILGLDQGAPSAWNGGATWSSWYNQPTAQIYHVIIDPRFPFWVYGAQQDTGAAGRFRRGDSGRSLCATFHDRGRRRERHTSRSIRRSGTSLRRLGRASCDMRTNQALDVDPTLAKPGPYRGTWTLPLAFSPADRTCSISGISFSSERRIGGELGADSPGPHARGPGYTGEP